VLLLGDAYVRLLGEQKASEVEERSLARRVTQRVPALLTAALQNPGLPAPQRLEAGLLLADLAIEPPGLDDFVTAPNWPFQTARYPVTNGQYRRFVEAGGYAPKNEKRWWSKEGQRYKKEGKWTAPRYWDNATLNRITQPVVGVSWYEAQAYCAWLTHTLRSAGQLTDQEEVRLPTAAQWEQATRSHDGRPYPWGKTFMAAHANTQESGLQQTTPVHMYPQGATPEGVCDLCGNVWEWIEDDESYGKGLRGGAYWNDAQNVGSAARRRYGPNNRFHDVGIRCVVVPISRSSF
jgi:formylglycine-generating enzyme required for sulfatase activity